jgi:basic membrane protein A
MVRRWLAPLSLAWLVACGGDDKVDGAGEPLKVGFVYVSPIGDVGWSYAHNEGRLEAEAHFGDAIATSFIENVPEGDAASTAIAQLVDSGHKLIFTTSYGFMDQTLAAAMNHPDVYFEHCSGYKTHGNMANYFGRMEQARYLTGLVAGRKTQVGKIGFVAAYPLPEVIRGINAFTRGVRQVNPSAEVHVRWTCTWYGPDVEEQKASELLDTVGVDLLAQHQDTTAPVFAARDRGAYAIGYNADMQPYAPDTVLTSAIWHWSSYYVDRIQQVLQGTWTSQSWWGHMDTGIVGLGSWGTAVDATLRAEIDMVRGQILAHSFDVFDGPLRKNNGTEWIPAGASLSDTEQLTMTDFLEGVVVGGPGCP